MTTTANYTGANILNPGFNLTLRPMQYPAFYEMYKNAIKNTWTVDEIDFSTDLGDLSQTMGEGDRHLINRLVAFFATGDSIVSNNLVLNLYKHIFHLDFWVNNSLIHYQKPLDTFCLCINFMLNPFFHMKNMIILKVNKKKTHYLLLYSSKLFLNLL